MADEHDVRPHVAGIVKEPEKSRAVTDCGISKNSGLPQILCGHTIRVDLQAPQALRVKLTERLDILLPLRHEGGRHHHHDRPDGIA